MEQQKVLYLVALAFFLTSSFVLKDIRGLLKKQVNMLAKQEILLEGIYIQMPKTKDKAEMTEILEKRYGTKKQSAEGKDASLV